MLGFLSLLLTTPSAPTTPAPAMAPAMAIESMTAPLSALAASAMTSAASATPTTISFAGDQPMTLQQLNVEITGVQLTLTGLGPITQTADDSHVNEAGFGVQVRGVNNGILAVNQIASSVQARVITQGLGH